MIEARKDFDIEVFSILAYIHVQGGQSLKRSILCRSDFFPQTPLVLVVKKGNHQTKNM